MAAFLKVGTLRSTARWPQSDGISGTSRSRLLASRGQNWMAKQHSICSGDRPRYALPPLWGSAPSRNKFPTIKALATCGCQLPFPPRRGWRGVGGEGGNTKATKSIFPTSQSTNQTNPSQSQLRRRKRHPSRRRKTADHSISKRRNPRLRTTQNQGMDVVRAFIGIHHFQIHQMPRHAKLVADAITAHHVARQAGNVE